MAINLLTAQEIEGLLGKKCFYRQSIYRMAQDNLISSYQVADVLYFLPDEVIEKALMRLARRIRNRIPLSRRLGLRIKYSETEAKTITVYSPKNGFKISASTDEVTEEEFLRKIEQARREVRRMADIPVDDHEEAGEPHPHHGPHKHHGPHGGHHPHGDHEAHREIIEALRRIEDRLTGIEERLGK